MARPDRLIYLPLGGAGEIGMNMYPVSYTHLTLPTILLV